jgi:CBS domain-containing protein
MKVRELELAPVVATDPDESIADAADRMRFYEVGSLAVLEHGSLVAIITERDIAWLVADRSDPDRLSVRFYMTSEPVTIDADADVREAGALMLGIGVRHLPVMDGERLVGMVSVRDVLMAELAAPAVV